MKNNSNPLFRIKIKLKLTLTLFVGDRCGFIQRLLCVKCRVSYVHPYIYMYVIVCVCMFVFVWAYVHVLHFVFTVGIIL